MNRRDNGWSRRVKKGRILVISSSNGNKRVKKEITPNSHIVKRSLKAANNIVMAEFDSNGSLTKFSLIIRFMCATLWTNR